MVNRVPKKLRGHPGEKIAQKSRNNREVNGRGGGCIGTVDLRKHLYVGIYICSFFAASVTCTLQVFWALVHW